MQNYFYPLESLIFEYIFLKLECTTLQNEHTNALSYHCGHINNHIIRK